MIDLEGFIGRTKINVHQLDVLTPKLFIEPIKNNDK